MFKKLYIFIFIFLIAGCVPNWYKPYGYKLFRQIPKNGTPGFTLGWIHGCESGLGTQFAGAIYMSFYTWKRDPDMVAENPNLEAIRKRYKKELRNVDWNNEVEVEKNLSDYNTIFWGAHAFCRHSALGILQTATMAPPLPGEDRYDPAAHTVGSIWKINGKGDTRYGAAIGGAGSMW